MTIETAMVSKAPDSIYQTTSHRRWRSSLSRTEMTARSTGDLSTTPIAFSDATATHTSSVSNAAGDAFRSQAHAVMVERSDSQSTFSKIEKQAKLLGEGLLTGAVLNPINAVTQLLDVIPGVHLPKLELSNQEEVNNSWSGKAGALVGTAADFVLTAGAVSSVGGIKGSSALAMGISGAIDGGVLTPTAGATTKGDLIAGRLESAVVMGASGAVMGAVVGKIEGTFADTAETSLTEKVKVKALAGAVGGTASGAVRAESKAILETGDLASAEDLAKQLAAGAVAGVAGKVQGSVNESLSNSAAGTITDSVAGKITSSSIASATGNAAGEAAQAEILKKQKPAATSA